MAPALSAVESPSDEYDFASAAASRAWVASLVVAALLGSAAVAIVIDVFLASRLEDGEALESPMMLPVARQLSHSPRELYGPFGGGNPLVLIHAPLYYRIAALLAWPMARAGLGFVTAALASGRMLSLLGLALTAAAAYRLARLDGAPARAGWLALSLLVTAPVVGRIPVYRAARHVRGCPPDHRRPLGALGSAL